MKIRHAALLLLIALAPARAGYVLIDIAKETDRKNEPLIEGYTTGQSAASVIDQRAPVRNLGPLLSDKGVVIYGFKPQRSAKYIFQPPSDPPISAQYNVYKLFRWEGGQATPIQTPNYNENALDYDGGFIPTAINKEGDLAGYTVMFTRPDNSSSNQVLVRPGARVGSSSGVSLKDLSFVEEPSKTVGWGWLNDIDDNGVTVGVALTFGTSSTSYGKEAGAKWQGNSGSEINGKIDNNNLSNPGHTFYPYAAGSVSGNSLIFGQYDDKTNPSQNEPRILEDTAEKQKVRPKPFDAGFGGRFNSQGDLLFQDEIWLRDASGAFTNVKVKDKSNSSISLEDFNSRMEGISDGYIWRNYKKYWIEEGIKDLTTTPEGKKIWGHFAFHSINESGTIVAIATKDEDKSGSIDPGTPPEYSAPDKRHVVLLVPIDIKVKKQGDNTPVEGGLIVKTGDTIEVSLSDIPQENFPIKAEDIVWQFRQIKQGGSFTDWGFLGAKKTGVKTTFTIQTAGIFQVKAMLYIGGVASGNTQEVKFLRKHNVANATDSEGRLSEACKKDQPDYFGVVEQEIQKSICHQAYINLGSTNYAQDASLVVRHDPIAGDIIISERVNKCNAFVYHKASDAGAIVPLTRPDGVYHTSPPLAFDWFDDTYSIPGWQALGTNVMPQPGFMVARPDDRTLPGGSNQQERWGHVGILDYDGSWIQAGKNTVNKYPHLTNGEYQPVTVRKYTGN